MGMETDAGRSAINNNADVSSDGKMKETDYKFMDVLRLAFEAGFNCGMLESKSELRFEQRTEAVEKWWTIWKKKKGL